MSDTPQDQRILDAGSVQPLKEITVPSFTLRLCSADDVNAAGRDLGLPVQAVAFTNPAGNTIYLSWPPNPHEYGYGVRSLQAALGYEILSNLLHLDYDPLGQ